MGAPSDRAPGKLVVSADEIPEAELGNVSGGLVAQRAPPPPPSALTQAEGLVSGISKQAHDSAMAIIQNTKA